MFQAAKPIPDLTEKQPKGSVRVTRSSNKANIKVAPEIGGHINLDDLSSKKTVRKKKEEQEARKAQIKEHS